jgi:hypothetical protein
MSDLSLQSEPKRTLIRLLSPIAILCQRPVCVGVTDEDICHQVESAGLGIITTNYTPPKIHNKFRLRLPNNKTRA